MKRFGQFRKNFFFLFLTSFFSLVHSHYAYSASEVDVSKEISKEERLLSLIEKEIVTISNVKKRGEQLDYRLFELLSEKTKILRKNEYRLSMKNPKAKIENKSLDWYNKSQSLGLDLLKRYPQGRFSSEIYYSLAGNMIEIRNQIEADGTQLERWLLDSLKFSRNGEEKYTAQVKLAEVYYTLKRFDDAIKVYEEVIKNQQDTWYPKNLYNYAWCIFQKKNYSLAVSLGLKAFYATKNKKYQDFSDQVKTAINYFYVFDKRPAEAIKFHIKETKGTEKAENLIKVVKLSQKYISSQVALDAEAQSREHCTAINDYHCLIPLSEFKLAVKRESKDYQGHYNAFIVFIKEFKAIEVKQKESYQELINLVINNAAEVASYLQGLAYKNHYIISQDKNKTYQRIINYYNGLKILNPPFRYEYEFLQAEISYKEEKFKEASQYYLASLEQIPTMDKASETQKTFLPKLFKSMLAYSNDERTKDDPFFEKTHISYLQYYPKEDHSVVIYKALFKFYQVKKDVTKSEEVMLSYMKNQPSKTADQKEMFKVVLNNYITNKNADRLTYWVGQMQNKFLQMDEEFIKQNIATLAQILFEKAKNLEDKGNFDLAIEEYRKIIDHPLYPSTIKNDCFFNISVNYIKLEKPLESIAWMEKALPKQSKESMKLKIDTILSMIQYYLLFQEFRAAKWAYEFIMPNHCDILKDTDRHFYQLQHIGLMQHDLKSVQQNYQAIPDKCKVSVSTLTQLKKDFVDYLFQYKHFDVLRSLLDQPAKGYVELSDYIFNLYESGWWNIPLNQKNLQDQYFSEMTKFRNLQSVNGTLSEGNKLVFTQMESLQKFYRDGLKLNLSIPVQFPFNVETLTKGIQEKLTLLISYKDRGLDLAKSTTNPNLYTSTLSLLYYTYTRAIVALEGYPISNVPLDYREDLANNLKELSQGMRSQRKDFYTSFDKINAKTPVINNFIRFFNQDDQSASWLNNVVSQPLKTYIFTKENS
ncbi:MAG: tetratricopeptide repeat protein [Bacteriovoracaceae bacterium]|nr:tetratricopeptide repeat protein [Bacteriovoracaceae bacterium]